MVTSMEVTRASLNRWKLQQLQLSDIYSTLEQGTGENVGEKAIPFSRRKTKPEHGATPANAVFLEAFFQTIFEAVRGAAFSSSGDLRMACCSKFWLRCVSLI